MPDQPTPNGSDLLTLVAAFIKRFVSLSDIQSVAIALWVAHTHALDAAETTPYLNISSAEKQCGKTRLLEVLSLLVANPWLTGSASKAVLVRKIDASQPTLLLDESDAAFAGDREYAEALRGVLNSGHSRDGVASLCQGQGANITWKDFRVFCPKAIAGIGKLPDIVSDRSIPIRMKRRAPHETQERFRRRLHKDESAKLAEHLASWLAPEVECLRSAKPVLPDALSDRQQDGCEPLLAIADLAGGDWPVRARVALVGILTGEAAEDGSTGIRLLSDICSVFQRQNLERIFTGDLLVALWDTEPQWLEFSYGKALSGAALARVLKGFEIAPRKIRIGDRTASGYLRDWFLDAWTRYLPCRLEQAEQCGNDAVGTQSSHLEQGALVPLTEDRKSPINTWAVPCVPSSGSGSEPPERYCRIHGLHTDWWERARGDGDWLCGRCYPRNEGFSGPESLLKARVPTAHDLGFKGEGSLFR